VGKIGGVMHCWTGNPEETQWFLDLGFYISFSGIVTFKNSKTVQAAAQIVPGDRILIETDCPFLSPNPHRGKPCEPSFVFHVAETVARLRGYPVETLAEQTTQNARNLFQLPS
jgi:TatD DNase family protein